MYSPDLLNDGVQVARIVREEQPAEDDRENDEGGGERLQGGLGLHCECRWYVYCTMIYCVGCFNNVSCQKLRIVDV